MNLCPNCESAKHTRCCSWCGKTHKPARHDMEHCSAKCEKAAAYANELSVAMQEDADEQQARANTKFRRVKVLFYLYGGKGSRSWREPHERYAWVPLEQAKNDRVTLAFPDVGEQTCSILARDTLVISGDLREQCEEFE